MEATMIDVKQAVRAAMQFAEELYGPRENLAYTLEEVVPSEDDRYWYVTLGFMDSGSPLAVMSGFRPQREYKVFQVDSEDGRVISMKIRSAA